jgi:hypothetical protein
MSLESFGSKIYYSDRYTADEGECEYRHVILPKVSRQRRDSRL